MYEYVKSVKPGQGELHKFSTASTEVSVSRMGSRMVLLFYVISSIHPFLFLSVCLCVSVKKSLMLMEQVQVSGVLHLGVKRIPLY